MPFLMQRTACSHTQRMAMRGCSLRLLKKSGAVTTTFCWVRTASTSLPLCCSTSCSGSGLRRWCGEQGSTVDVYCRILHSRYTSSSLLSRNTALSRNRMLKFSWLPRTNSRSSHFSYSSRQSLLSMSSRLDAARQASKGLSLEGRGVGDSWRLVCQSTRFMRRRWSLTRFSSKLVLRWKARSRSCTRSSSSPSMRFVRQQVSSSSPSSPSSMESAGCGERAKGASREASGRGSVISSKKMEIEIQYSNSIEHLAKKGKVISKNGQQQRACLRCAGGGRAGAQSFCYYN